ncbi:hypothetical protein H4K36_01285 [Streptomyces sp. DHE7-1]|nr:hypothetical protein [Streptomyces sp. DHE7-1]
MVLEYFKALLFGRLSILRGGVAEAEFADAAADLRVETEIAVAEQLASTGHELSSVDCTVTLPFQEVLEHLLSKSCHRCREWLG